MTIIRFEVRTIRRAAALAAELVGGGGSTPHVDEVEPTGPFEDDPNVTDMRFPGNPTRSFRTTEPVRIVRTVEDWTRLTPEALERWREVLVAKAPEDRGEIRN